MKLWTGYGSEHSANLVMIGTFKDVSDATKTKQKIETITEKVLSCVDSKKIEVGEHLDHFPEDVLKLLSELKLYSLSAAELEQFAYDTSVEIQKNQVIIKTDEIDVSAFFKILFDNDAHIEIYSAHTYSEPDLETKTGS